MGEKIGRVLGKAAGYLSIPLIAAAIADKYNLDPGYIALGAYPIMLFTGITGFFGGEAGKYIVAKKYKDNIDDV